MLLLTEPPDNGSFMIAAYVIVAIVLSGYSMSLLRKASRLERS
jgi:hypothetical protein